jgi:hypothetical protein
MRKAKRRLVCSGSAASISAFLDGWKLQRTRLEAFAASCRPWSRRGFWPLRTCFGCICFRLFPKCRPQSARGSASKSSVPGSGQFRRGARRRGGIRGLSAPQAAGRGGRRARNKFGWLGLVTIAIRPARGKERQRSRGQLAGQLVHVDICSVGAITNRGLKEKNAEKHSLTPGRAAGARYGAALQPPASSLQPTKKTTDTSSASLDLSLLCNLNHSCQRN